MGFHEAFIAVKGPSKAEVLDRLGLLDTGESTDPLDCPLSVATLEDGWTLVWSRDCNFPSPERMQAVSAGAKAVGWAVEERAMGSGAFGYDDGAETWSILYDCDSDHPLRARGKLPRAFAKIRREAEARQEAEGDGVDLIWDVPADVAESVCHFAYRDGDQVDGASFTRLRPTPAADRFELASKRPPPVGPHRFLVLLWMRPLFLIFIAYSALLGNWAAFLSLSAVLLLVRTDRATLRWAGQRLRALWRRVRA